MSCNYSNPIVSDGSAVSHKAVCVSENLGNSQTNHSAPLHYHSLQAIRLLSCVAVIWFHFYCDHPSWPGNWAVIFLGYFFALSGFVLSKRFGNSKFNIEKTARFYARRVAAIAPTYIVINLATYIHLSLSNEPYGRGFRSPTSLLAVLTMTHAWFPTLALDNGINVAAWFVSDLIFLYFSFPFIHNLSHRVKSVQHIVYSGTVLIAAPLTLQLWALYTFGDTCTAPNLRYVDHFFNFWPPMMIPIFSCGILTAKLKAILEVKGTQVENASDVHSPVYTYNLLSHLSFLTWLIPFALLVAFADPVDYGLCASWRTILTAPFACGMIYTLTRQDDLLNRIFDWHGYSKCADVAFTCFLAQYPVYNLLKQLVPESQLLNIFPFALLVAGIIIARFVTQPSIVITASLGRLTDEHFYKQVTPHEKLVFNHADNVVA